LFISIRSGASVCHDRAVRSVPRAARIGSLGLSLLAEFDQPDGGLDLGRQVAVGAGPLDAVRAQQGDHGGGRG
jgi:hypothetical protein